MFFVPDAPVTIYAKQLFVSLSPEVIISHIVVGFLAVFGARYLLADSNEPKAGDYIIMPEMPKFWVPSTQVQFRSKVDSAKEISSSIPLRLFNRRSNAGFYSHFWGYLPMAISTEPDEVFTLLKVVR